jgi:UDP-glucuronate 4-epimerase
VKLLEFIHILEEELGEKARMNLLPMQAGDVASTWADCGRLARDTGYRSRISLREGIRRFAAWYREFYDL